MDRDEHAPFRENIPAYALGALDAADVTALESHLRTCESCRNELAEYRALGDILLMATPPAAPPAALRKRLQAQLPSAQKAARPRWTWNFGQLALGLAMLALLALNLFTFSQLRLVQRQQARLSTEVEDAQVALMMLSSPSTQTVFIQGTSASGAILLDKGQNEAVMIVEGLPPLPSDQIYQIWLILPDGSRVSGGLFRPQTKDSYTTKAIASGQTISGYIGIGVTVEPAGGSDHPTGERMFKVDF